MFLSFALCQLLHCANGCQNPIGWPNSALIPDHARIRNPSDFIPTNPALGPSRAESTVSSTDDGAHFTRRARVPRHLARRIDLFREPPHGSCRAYRANATVPRSETRHGGEPPREPPSHCAPVARRHPIPPTDRRPSPVMPPPRHARIVAATAVILLAALLPRPSAATAPRGSSPLAVTTPARSRQTAL